jgi:hypothetical protein
VIKIYYTLYKIIGKILYLRKNMDDKAALIMTPLNGKALENAFQRIISEEMERNR